MDRNLEIIKKYLVSSRKHITFKTDLHDLQRFVGFNIAIDHIIIFIDQLSRGKVEEDYIKDLLSNKVE